MKKYKLSEGRLCVRPLDGSEPQYCVLGVYLAEKHAYTADELIENRIEAYEKLHERIDDLWKMARAIWLDPQSPRKNYLEYLYDDLDQITSEPVYAANDGGCPVEILNKALKAVGIEVELEDVRDVVPGRRWAPA